MSQSPISNISLQLGDIIKLIAPGNTDLDNKIFFIQYLDKQIIKLIDTETTDTHTIGLTQGSIDDKSIKSIEILSHPTEKGYAKQNGLLPGVWISIQLGGDIPTTVNGEITNIEEDMIELSVYPSDVKIYIDFAYKGIPEHLPIEDIRNFTPPKIIQTEGKDKTPFEEGDESKEGKENTPLEEDDEGAEIEEYELGDNGFEDIQLVEERDNNLKEGDAIRFGGELDELELIVDVPENEMRYSIEEQSNDLLDDLLSTIPTDERTKRKTNSLHRMITRFQQLREIYSVTTTNDALGKPIPKGKYYSSLTEAMINLHTNLPWFIPVVKNSKVIYDADIDEEDAIIGITETTLANAQHEYNTLNNQYKNDAYPDGQNKYDFLYKSLKPLLTPFGECRDMQNIMVEKRTNVDINVITDNDGDLFTHVLAGNIFNEYTTKSKASSTQLSKHKYNFEKYITGMTALQYIDIKDETPIQKLQKITKNDKLSITGIVTLPMPAVKYSNINLPNTNIYKRSQLNQIPFIYSQYLNNRTKINTTEINEKELFNKQRYDIKRYSKRTEFYTFTQNVDMDDRKEDVYKRFLNRIIPDTLVIFDQIKDNISNKLSYDSVIDELQPFMINSDDITFKTYETIVRWIDSNLLEFVKALQISKNYYNSYVNFRYGRDIDIGFKNSYLFELLTPVRISDSLIEIKKKYLLTKATTNEFIRLLLITDSGSLFMDALTLEEIDLFVSLNVDKAIKDGIADLQTDKVNDDECKNLTIAKFYLDVDDLRNDDGNANIFFDKKLDETRYDIIGEFNHQRQVMTDDAFKEFLINHLNQNVGLNVVESTREANALIDGRRKIIQGDYAYITDVTNANHYYVRDDNNVWINKPDMDGIPLDKATFCNLTRDCLTIKNVCGNAQTNKALIKKQVMTEMIEKFDNENTLSNAQLLKKLTDKLTYSSNSITYIQKLLYNDQLKNDIYKRKLGEQLQHIDVGISPNTELMGLILAQQDFVKKQGDILLFISKKCRPAQTTNNESEYWYYCLETNTKLLPTFFGTLANAFASNTYNEVLEEISARRGDISDDGDKVVDKHSGYTIKRKEFDDSEGYDETGYKLVSRSILEDDIGDIIINTSTDPIKATRSRNGQMIHNVIMTICKQMFISINNQIDFIIQNVENTLGNLPNEELYNKRILVNKKKGRRTRSYKDFKDNTLLLLTLGYFLVITQTMIPGINTTKSSSGCGRNSFIGYPLHGEGDYSAIKYLACVVLKIKSDNSPWTHLPRFKKVDRNVNIKKFTEKIKLIIDGEILTNIEIKAKIQLKLEYDGEHKEDEACPKLFNVNNWTTFLPPLHEIKIGKLASVSPNFEELIKEEIKSGDSGQFRRLSILQGKITLHSLKIQEYIQTAVGMSVLILENIENELLMENSCCNTGEKITIMYFNKEQPKILKTNNTVIKLDTLRKEILALTRPPFIFDRTDTRIKHPPMSNMFSEETIYKAFIHFCRFNTGSVIRGQLFDICRGNKSGFKMDDDIETKIDIMKGEGYVYSLQSFKELINIINKRNILNVELNKSVFSSKIIYEENLRADYTMQSVEGTQLARFIEMFSKVLAGADIRESNKEFESLDLFLSRNIDELGHNINSFISNNAGITRYNTFLNTVESWKLRGENIYMSKEDETAICYYNYSKNSIFNLLKAFPTIILNKVDNSKIGVPEHWKSGSQKLSTSHVKDIQHILTGELAGLNKFYGMVSIEKILNRVSNSCINEVLMNIIEKLPFIADIKVEPGKPRVPTILNGPIVKKISKYITLYVFQFYIDNLGEIIQENAPIERKDDEQVLIIEDEIIKGRNTESAHQLASLLQTYMKIMSNDKKYLNISNIEINKKVLKSQEKEKAKITNKLGDLSVDERRIEDLMKTHRLGDWGVGQTKALFIYDESQYDKERQELEADAILEQKLNGIDGITESLRDIYKMDFLDEVAESNQINRELDSDIMGAPGDDGGDGDGDKEFDY
tara:strand:+ start:12835 stop:18774 length:5940 start_codon:yes stop_codon:yes gene_type:complete